LKRNALHGTKH
jgi:hypothetical protein